MKKRNAQFVVQIKYEQLERNNKFVIHINSKEVKMIENQRKTAWNKCILLICLVSLSLMMGGCVDEAKKIREETQKLQNITNVEDIKNIRFLEKRSKSVSEKEFIEWHRAYQDQQKPYSKNLILQYKNLYEKFNKPEYIYLYSRTLPYNESLPMLENLVKNFPKFAYSYNALGSIYYENAASVDDIKKAQLYIQQGMEIDKDIPMAEALPLINFALEQEQKAKNMQLKVNIDSKLSFIKYRTTKIGINKFRIQEMESYGSYGWFVKKNITVEMKFKGLCTIVTYNKSFTEEKRPGFGAWYQFIVSEPAYIYLLLIGNSDVTRQKSYSISKSDTKSMQGVIDAFFYIEDIAGTEYFVIDNMN